MQKMTLEQLEASGRIIHRVISGSHAYGTNNATSDVDIRGFFWVPSREYISTSPPVSPKAGQVNDEKNDIVFYSLYRAIELLKTANPNMIELLWIPQDCIVHSNSVIMGPLLDHRRLFVSKQTYWSHANYAIAQIKKAKGANKKVHNPQPKERPVKEDFCRFVFINDLADWFNADPFDFKDNIKQNKYPMRPIPFKDVDIDLSKHHVASFEHAANVFRLYYYGDEAKGVFRGDDMLVCESIPKEDEWNNIVGLLLYDKNEYEKAIRDWNSYWDWMKNRNEARWIDQEKGTLNYDQKNMMHCMRLMMSAEHILTEGEPLVRFEGDQLKYLMSIRNGEQEYAQLMEEVDKRQARLEHLFKTSKVIPEHVNEDAIESLYRSLMAIGDKEMD